MQTLESFICGEWQEGSGDGAILVDPTTEAPLAVASTEGVNFAAGADWGRDRGGPALRGMTFSERAAMLKAMWKALHAHRDELLDLAVKNGGNTRGDAKFDIDGAIGTLSAYAEMGEGLGDSRVALDGQGYQTWRTPRYWGQHIRVPREGVAVLINAYNFPAWGFAEKAACALLAGMPVIVKPATSTALVTWRMVRILVEDGVIPEGALQLVAGSCGDLLSHLGEQDVVAFTGSAATGLVIRSMENLLRRSVPVNVEADSLNSAVLAPGLDLTSDTTRLFLRDVLREVIQKAGQKCTAVRRIFVPSEMMDDVEAELVHGLQAVKVGDPALAEVGMGPLSTAEQLRDARAGIEELSGAGRVVTGGPAHVDAVGVEAGKGYFVSPTLIRIEDPASATVAHRLEVFGPVATLMPYDGSPEAASALVKMGEGSLVSSAYGDDADWLREMATGLATWNGRVYLGSEGVASSPISSGMALPFLRHGGPGRAGGGTELGALRGLSLYQHCVALQGDRGVLVRMFPGAIRSEISGE